MSSWLFRQPSCRTSSHIRKRTRIASLERTRRNRSTGEEEQKEEYQTSAVAYRIPRRPSMRRVHSLSKTQTTLECPASPTPSARPLTDREQEILDLMRKGQKNREIAATLCIAKSTVHKHVQNIFEKLHARNRTEAIYLTSAAN